jgi:aminopeptidase N
MLRAMLGDEVFYAGVRAYVNRHALGTAETSDFRAAMEEASGLGLEWFFEQWCYRTGLPELDVDVRYDPETRELAVSLRQTQTIDAPNPAFRFDLPVRVRTAQGERTIVIPVRERSAAATAVLDGPPEIVAVDPWLTVLKKTTTSKPLALWMAEAAQGPTIAARHEALGVLAGHDDPAVIDLVASIAADETERHTLRRSAGRALARLGSGDARARHLAILREGVADPRVRAGLVEGLRGFPPEDVKEMLAEFAANDPSYDTRVAAIEILAAMKSKAHADLFLELVEYPSHADQVRNAAIRALAALDDTRGLAPAMTYSAPGYSDRSRAQTIGAVGTLAKHDPETAIPFLLALLDDPEHRAVHAAGAALAETGDKRAAGVIRAISQSSRDPRLRAQAAEWLKKLDK